MEIFDFVAESKKFISTFKDLLEIQYRHVLDEDGESVEMGLKIRQGLERSAQSIYTWIETVVQDWEQRISGFSSAISLLTSPAVSQPTQVTENWARSSNLPPSPALTPVVSVNEPNASNMSHVSSESQDSNAQASSSNSSTKKRYNNPPHKKPRRSEIPIIKSQTGSHIPVPTPREGTPHLLAKAISTGSLRRASRPVLPSQSSASSLSSNTASTLSQNPPVSYQQQPHWDPHLAVSSPYVPYTSGTGAGTPIYHSAGPGTPLHYHPDALVSPHHPDAAVSQHHGNQVVSPTYFHPEVPTDSLSQPMHHNSPPAEPFRPQSTGTIRGRMMSSSATPRSSVTSTTWMRDENRDSSQTLVEPHPPCRCGDMYCLSCNKTMPDDSGHMQVQLHVPQTVPGHHHTKNPHEIYGAGEGYPDHTVTMPQVTGPYVEHAHIAQWAAYGHGGGGGAHDHGDPMTGLYGHGARDDETF